MPNYNSPFLYRAILSVVKQEYKEWELIIIDNFSNNFPEKIVNQFNDDRIRFYKFNNSNNIAKARNFGIKKSKFDWIAFLDSDDVWKKNKMLKVAETIKNNETDFIYHGMYYLPKKFWFFKIKIKHQSKEIKKPIYKTLFEEGNGIANSSVVVKKNILAKINFLSEDQKKYSWEDYDCWIRYSKLTDKFYFIPIILGFCWVGGGNISSLDQTYKNYQNFHKIYKKQIFEISKKKRLQWFNKFLIVWYLKKNYIYRAYLLQKKVSPNDLKSFVRLILIKALFFYDVIKKSKRISFFK